MTDATGSFVAALPVGAFIIFEATGGHEQPLMAAHAMAGAHHARLRLAREERAIHRPGAFGRGKKSGCDQPLLSSV